MFTVKLTKDNYRDLKKDNRIKKIADQSSYNIYSRTFFIPSQSTKGIFYKVYKNRFNIYSCTCDYMIYRKTKHNNCIHITVTKYIEKKILGYYI